MLIPLERIDLVVAGDVLVLVVVRVYGPVGGLCVLLVLVVCGLCRGAGVHSAVGLRVYPAALVVVAPELVVVHVAALPFVMSI